MSVLFPSPIYLLWFMSTIGTCGGFWGCSYGEGHSCGCLVHVGCSCFLVLCICPLTPLLHSRAISPPPSLPFSSPLGDCRTEQQQNFVSLPLIASVTIVAALVILVFFVLLFVVLLVRIRRLKQGEPVKTSSTTSSDSSENSVTTESESLPSPTSTSSPHHHYLHITADDPAFGDSLNKCKVSKA